MSPSQQVNPVRQRRSELGSTQQEAARRAEVSVATWRRLEAATALDGFKADNIRASPERFASTWPSSIS